MSDPKHDKPNASRNGEPVNDDNALDIEPDALLDSLLSDGPGPRASVPTRDDEEEEVTGVVHPGAPPDENDAFNDVDELLTSSAPPPPAPDMTHPTTGGAKRTLQGIKPVGVPRPGVSVPRPGLSAPRPALRQPGAGSSTPPPLPNPPRLAPNDSGDDDPTLRAIDAGVDRESQSPPQRESRDRLSHYGLADELEPDDVGGFEDLDEDILESVPPEPMESLSSQPPDALPESLAPDALDSMPPDALETFGPDASGSRTPDALDLVVPHAISSIPPDPRDTVADVSLPLVEPEPRSDLETLDADAFVVSSASEPPPAPSLGAGASAASPTRTSDAFLEDESTELLDSLPDEALGTYGSERPAADYLAERGLLDEWRQRAEWFEFQAATMTDPAAKARALLIASEHFAQAGDIAKARAVAGEIHAVQPAMAMGSRQMRWLAAVEQDFKAVAGALELETRASPTPVARAHASNLAADVQRVCFDDMQGARRKLDLAARVLPGDPRPYVLRLAEQLGQSAGPPRLRGPENEELAALNHVASELERLRGPSNQQVGQPASTAAITFEEIRRALASKDIAKAVDALSRLSRARGMQRSSLWLGAALAAHSEKLRPRALLMLQQLVENESSSLARLALAARAVELGDADGARAALFEGDELSSAFDAATRIVMAALTSGELPSRADDLKELADGPQRPLAAAAESASVALDSPRAVLVGEPRQRDELLTGQALANTLIDSTSDEPLQRLRQTSRHLGNTHGEQPFTQIMGLEFSLPENDATAIARALEAWPGIENGPAKALAAALVLELGGQHDAAKRQLRQALDLDPDHEGAARALMTGASPEQAAELLAELADNSDDPTQAGFLLLEAALVRHDDPKAAEEHLVQASTTAPDLPLVYLHGERHARQRGDAEMLLSWLRQRRDSATDSIDKAFDLVREALLIAESDMALAANLLAEALTARPDDVALQELHERLGAQAGVERGKWREKVAEQLPREARQRLLAEAALEYERAGDLESAARVASSAAEGTGSEFARLTAERLQIARGDTASLSEALLKAARQEQDEQAQREVYERLSELDELKGDHSSALLWQSAILERAPSYLPALRKLEHEYIGADRWDDLEPIALELARQLDPSEADARATWVAQHRILSGKWESAREAIELACKLEPPSLWALRAFASQARGSDDLDASLRVDLELMNRARTALDTATLSLRAAEAATRLEKLDAARALLQRAIQQVPNHLVALTTLADVLEAMGAAHDAAEALEAAATAYRTDKHQVELWHQAAVLWQDQVGDEQRAIHALEAAIERDVAHSEAFERLQGIYVKLRETQKLADLLERRLESTDSPEERVSIEVQRGRALAGVGERQAAKEALAAALDASPEHAEALDAFATLCMEEGDWTGAEGAWIRLARHEGDTQQQVAIYTKLGGLYDDQLPNPQRAERAYQEVLKRDPGNVTALERLVEVHVSLHHEEEAVALQQQLIDSAADEDEKRDRTLQLAHVVERVAQDSKRALAILEAAKKTYGNDSRVLRAHAEFLQRRGEDRALGMLLDRAANESRRALITGRFDVTFFDVLATVSELRGSLDGAAVARGTLAALRGDSVELTGAGPRAADPRLDELLAPAALSAPLRMLLAKAGRVLDDAYPVDLKSLRAEPLPADHSLGQHVQQVASAFGIQAVEVFTSPALGPICMPAGSQPARIVYGQSLLKSDKDVARFFLLIRALKIIQAGATALSRTAPIDLWPLMAGFLGIFASNWEPQGADPRKTAQAAQRIRAAMPGGLDNDVPMLALEVIGSIGNRASQLGVATHQFGNRTGLLAVGDPNAALDGIALAAGQEGGLPETVTERLKWIVRNSEARDVAVFSVSDPYFKAREALDIQTA